MNNRIVREVGKPKRGTFLGAPGKLLGMAFLLAACNQTGPLTINLINPITKEFRTCTAREATPKNTEALAATVEVCAKQLEARGYVRDD